METITGISLLPIKKYSMCEKIRCVWKKHCLMEKPIWTKCGKSGNILIDVVDDGPDLSRVESTSSGSKLRTVLNNITNL